MSVSRELQDLIADISAAIAAKKSWNRTEQEKVRRTLTELARDAQQQERQAGHLGAALAQLTEGVEKGVADLTGLVRRTVAIGAAGVEAGR